MKQKELRAKLLQQKGEPLPLNNELRKIKNRSDRRKAREELRKHMS